MKLATPNRRQLGIGAILGTAALLLPQLIPVEHHFPWDAVPGFYALYGAIGCAAIVVVSKWLGRALLLRAEDWYGVADAPDQPHPPAQEDR